MLSSKCQLFGVLATQKSSKCQPKSPKRPKNPQNVNQGSSKCQPLPQNVNHIVMICFYMFIKIILTIFFKGPI
jgi:hypothetical protein